MADPQLKAAKQSALAGLCDFVLGWFDIDESLAGAPIDSDAPTPMAARILNDKLGALWEPGDHLIGENRMYGGLFDCQNVISDPSTYSEDAAPGYGAGGDLAVRALAENQGVTNFGFALDDPDGAVYVCGDWLGSYGPWRPTEGYIEDAFAMYLLINFFAVDGETTISVSQSLDQMTTELYASGPGLGSERYGVWRAVTDDTLRFIYYDHLGWKSRD